MLLRCAILEKVLCALLLFMFSPIRKIHPVVKVINNAVVDLPAARNLSAW